MNYMHTFLVQLPFEMSVLYPPTRAGATTSVVCVSSSCTIEVYIDVFVDGDRSMTDPIDHINKSFAIVTFSVLVTAAKSEISVLKGHLTATPAARLRGHRLDYCNALFIGLPSQKLIPT